MILCLYFCFVYYQIGAFELLHAWAISLNYYCDFFSGDLHLKRKDYIPACCFISLYLLFFFSYANPIINNICLFGLSSGFMLLKSQSYYFSLYYHMVIGLRYILTVLIFRFGISRSIKFDYSLIDLETPSSLIIMCCSLQL